MTSDYGWPCFRKVSVCSVLPQVDFRLRANPQKAKTIVFVEILLDFFVQCVVVCFGRTESTSAHLDTAAVEPKRRVRRKRQRGTVDSRRGLARR
jgi:hypothetical protein